jgi:hypothetical protein
LSRIANETHVPLALLRSLNPALLRDRTPPDAESYPIRIPDNTLQASNETRSF